MKEVEEWNGVMRRSEVVSEPEGVRERRSGME